MDPRDLRVNLNAYFSLLTHTKLLFNIRPLMNSNVYISLELIISANLIRIDLGIVLSKKPLLPSLSITFSTFHKKC